MNISRFVAVTLLGLSAFGGLGLSATATAQIEIPNPGVPGGSFDTAVRLVVTSDLMLDRQISRWLRTHYAGWDAEPHQIQEMGEDRYAVVYIQHKDHPSRRVYFRILQSHADPDSQSPAFPF